MSMRLKSRNINLSLIFVIAGFLVLSVYSSFVQKRDHDINAKQIISFKAFKNKYFVQNYPKFETTLDKPGKVAAIITIHRDNLTVLAMEKVQQQLRLDGWHQVKSTQDQLEYCFGEYQRINIIAPSEIKDRQGKIIYHDGINSWKLMLYYNVSGIESCIASARQ